MRQEREILQGLEKGLDVLAALNQARGMRIAEVARELDLPRTTAMRVLGTLRANGFVERNDCDGRFRPTVKVRTLSDGYDDAGWIVDVALPELRTLTREIAWPALISTPLGASMVWRANTDRETTMTLTRHPVGRESPILGSACGRILLAYCGDQERKTLINLLRETEGKHRPLLATEHLSDLIARVRAQGYAVFLRPHEYTLAVPILSNSRYVASLAIRVIMRAMSSDELVARYCETLKHFARTIADKIEVQSDGCDWK